MELKRVVVTGLGAITPLGNTLPETWEGIINGKSGAGPITQFDASKFKTQFACEVKGFDPLKVMDRKEARKCDRYSLFAIDAAKQAIEDAAMDLDKEDKNRIGVIFASGIGGIKTFDEEPDLQILNGRYGIYIAYKKANYKIPKTVENPAELTLEQAREIIASQPAPKSKAKGRATRQKKS